MKYELAKELKDAGWPQRDADDYILPRGQVVTAYWQGDGQEDGCAIPTLSELIEACGEKFGALLRVQHTGEWWAVEIEEFRDGVSHIERNPGPAFKATTPLEAVARLWLALNRKP